MEFKEDIQTLAVQIKEKKPHITNEETTKNSLIMPFIQALGYDFSDPREVQSEFVSDYGKRRGTKVDYALFKDGNPIIFIEAKPVDEILTNDDAQLEYYMNNVPDVKLGLLTNGIEYRFFSKVKEANIMDKTPFFTLSFLSLKDSDIDTLSKFRKETYDKDQVMKNAVDLAYTSTLNSLMKDLLNSPSEEFIRFLLKNSKDIDITVTTKATERFRPIVKEAINNAILDMVSKRLPQTEKIIIEEKLVSPKKTSLTSVQENQKIQEEAGEPAGTQVETTDEERTAFNIVKSILEKDGKDTKNLDPRDTVNYYSINNGLTTKWFIRFVLKPNNKSLSVRITPEKANALIKGFTIEPAPAHLGGGSRVYFNKIMDIWKLQKLIVSSFDEVNQS